MDWRKLVEVVVPLVLDDIPKTKPLAPLVAQAIVVAEGLRDMSGQPLTGAQKLDAAVKLTAIGVDAVNAEAGKKVLDPKLVNSALTKGISAAVDVAHVVSAAHDAMAHAVVTGALTPAAAAVVEK